MLRCSTENVSGKSNFETPILTSEGKIIFSIEGEIIVLKEIDKIIFVTVRNIVVVRERAEAH